MIILFALGKKLWTVFLSRGQLVESIGLVLLVSARHACLRTVRNNYSPWMNERRTIVVVRKNEQATRNRKIGTTIVIFFDTHAQLLFFLYASCVGTGTTLLLGLLVIVSMVGCFRPECGDCLVFGF